MHVHGVLTNLLKDERHAELESHPNEAILDQSAPSQPGSWQKTREAAQLAYLDRLSPARTARLQNHERNKWLLFEANKAWSGLLGSKS